LSLKNLIKKLTLESCDLCSIFDDREFSALRRRSISCAYGLVTRFTIGTNKLDVGCGNVSNFDLRLKEEFFSILIYSMSDLFDNGYVDDP
jgi:hypothetical protein